MGPADDTGVAGVSLKKLKEEFVSNLQGSTMLEIAALSALVPAFVLLRQIGCLLFSGDIKRCIEQSEPKGKVLGTRALLTILVKDFLFVGVPTLACLTVLADWVYIETVVAVFLAISGIYLFRLNGQSGWASAVQENKYNLQSHKTFLSSFRFTMMLVTCVTILAVDFHIFPRRYAKTEIYGTGLMDVGVGSFVVANGLVSKQARNLPPSKYGGVIRNTSPLLVLGFARLILTKGVDYQEHVAEYGVHWNFFFTLAAVALLTSLIHVPASLCGILGAIILGVYQAILSSGLNDYLLSPERGPDLISLNKEGICSILGYWSMYLISVQLGYHLCRFPARLFNNHSDVTLKGREKGTALRWIAVDVWVLDAFFWLLAIFMDNFIEKVSRRTCNLGYVAFVFAMNLEVIAIFLTAELFVTSKPILLQQIFDHNLLATFLMGNVLTGFVNMTVDTFHASSLVAMVTMVAYLASLVGGMASVDFAGLRLKFW